MFIWNKLNIVKDDKYRKKIIFVSPENNYNISIGGKIDGINVDDGSIIEIKNRMNKKATIRGAL